MFKPCQVFLQQHELFFTFGIPQVNLQKLRLPFCIYLSGNVQSVVYVAQQYRKHQQTNATRELKAKPYTGISVLNVVHFFITVHSFISKLFVTCFLLLKQACTVKVFRS